MHFIHSYSKNHLGISLWLLTLTLMSFFIIIIGGLTRLTNSGLSIVDWRPIMGTIPPLTNLAWIEVFNSYKSTPEFQIVNKSIALSEFKFIFWWEWFHRFFCKMYWHSFYFTFIIFLV